LLSSDYTQIIKLSNTIDILININYPIDKSDEAGIMELKFKTVGLEEVLRDMTVTAVAKLLEVSRPTIYAMLDEGRYVRFRKVKGVYEAYEVTRLI